MRQSISRKNKTKRSQSLNRVKIRSINKKYNKRIQKLSRDYKRSLQKIKKEHRRSIKSLKRNVKRNRNIKGKGFFDSIKTVSEPVLKSLYEKNTDIIKQLISKLSLGGTVFFNTIGLPANTGYISLQTQFMILPDFVGNLFSENVEKELIETRKYLENIKFDKYILFLESLLKKDCTSNVITNSEIYLKEIRQIINEFLIKVNFVQLQSQIMGSSATPGRYLIPPGVGSKDTIMKIKDFYKLLFDKLTNIISSLKNVKKEDIIKVLSDKNIFPGMGEGKIKINAPMIGNIEYNYIDFLVPFIIMPTITSIKDKFEKIVSLDNVNKMKDFIDSIFNILEDSKNINFDKLLNGLTLNENNCAKILENPDNIKQTQLLLKFTEFMQKFKNILVDVFTEETIKIFIQKMRLLFEFIKNNKTLSLPVNTENLIYLILNISGINIKK